MSPDLCYPEMVRVMRWATVQPVAFPSQGDIVLQGLAYGWSWVLLSALHGFLLTLLVVLAIPHMNRSFRDWPIYAYLAASTLATIAWLAALAESINPELLVWLATFGIIGGLTLSVLMGAIGLWTERTPARLAARGSTNLHEFLKHRWLWVNRVHRDKFGTLVRTRLGWAGPWLYAVLVKDSTTGQEYALRVDPELRPLGQHGDPTGNPQRPTARAAVASTFGLYAHEYQPGVET